MMFSPPTCKEFAGSFKWFLGRGRGPDYGRWTYWEKFDYFAVFWGVAVIGALGAAAVVPDVLHPPVPGWLLNVATIIHSDEALLAVGFIFTVHFFNTHFRPEKFPMDTVDLHRRHPARRVQGRTGRASTRSWCRAASWSSASCPRPIRATCSGWRIFGSIALSLGIVLILLILYAAIFGYR